MVYLYQFPLRTFSGRKEGFPEIYEYGTIKASDYIIMELLGASLDKIWKAHNHKFSLKCVLMIGVQLVKVQ